MQVILALISSAALSVLLVGCGSSEALPAACNTTSTTPPTGNLVNVYFGCGCFWHMQHAFVLQEMSELCRQGEDITARTAYAGGSKTGPDGLVCYHNSQGTADYGQMGHSEVVSMKVPEAAFGSFAAKFFELCPGGRRQDTQDGGGEYRSVIGVPGGMSSSLQQQLSANAGSAKLVDGKGDEGDTLGSGNILVYDTAVFPAHVAEKYHQFHDDMMASYGSAYNGLNKIAKATSCPGDETTFLQ